MSDFRQHKDKSDASIVRQKPIRDNVESSGSFRQTKESAGSTNSYRQSKDNVSTSNQNSFRQSKSQSTTSPSGYRQSKEDLSKKPTRYFSSRQETAVAAAIGGKKTANSGATVHEKGDVTVDGKHGWLIECKTCMKDQKSFSMKKDWFDKNRDESLFMRKDFTAVVFNFGPNSKNYYVVDENTFVMMKEALEKYLDEIEGD